MRRLVVKSCAFSTISTWGLNWCVASASSGIGPRDTDGDSGANAVGGSTYFGGTAEVQFPIFGIPREIGLRGAVFADAGTLFGYRGKKQIDVNGNGVINCAGVRQSECLNVRDEKNIRSSIGAGLLWASPLGSDPVRLRLCPDTCEGCWRGDQLQAFRFSGGARF